MDPEIAELIGVGPEEENEEPQFATLLETDESPAGLEELPPAESPISQSFAKITQFEEAPKPFFTDKNYYKLALAGEGENAQKLHKLLSDFLAARDPKDRSLLRGKLMAAFWNLTSGIAAKVQGRLPLPKQLVLRYACLLPTLIS